MLAGPVDLGVGAVLESAAAHLHVPGFSTSLSPTEEAILWQIRVPRVVLAALVGAMLALAGATYQGVFRNPLADPVPARRGGRGRARRHDRIVVPARRPSRPADPPGRGVRRRLRRGGARVCGRPLGAPRAGRGDADPRRRDGDGVLHRLQTFVQQQNSETLREVYSWILGGSRRAGWHDVVLVLPVRRASPSSCSSRTAVSLDVLSLGDDEAASLGVDVAPRPAGARRRGDPRDGGGGRP